MDAGDLSWAGAGFGAREGGGEGGDKDYDRDPEFAEILGSCIDDPDKAKSKVSLISLSLLKLLKWFMIDAELIGSIVSNCFSY